MRIKIIPLITIISFCYLAAGYAEQTADRVIPHFFQSGKVPQTSNFDETAEKIIIDQWQMQSQNSEWLNISLPFYVSSADTKDRNIHLRAVFNYQSKNDKNLILFCRGIKGSAKIVLNGNFVGFQPNSYAPFKYGMPAELIKQNEKNTLELYIFEPDTPKEGFPQYVNLFSEERQLGLPRSIDLWETPKYDISDFSVSVSSIRKKAIISISYKLNSAFRSALQNDHILTVEETLKTNDNTVLYHKKNKPNELKIIQSQTELDIKNLWSPQSPQVHNFNVKISIADEILLQKNISIGLRQFRVSHNKFLLNNQPITIKGINYHENLSSLENKIYIATIAGDFKNIKMMGFNAVRFPHYLPDPALVYIADSLGIMLFAEIPIWRYPEAMYLNDHLLENTKTVMQAVGRFYNNHPSLVAVSLGSEIPLYRGATQKFMLILKGIARSTVNIPIYTSPIPRPPFGPERVSDFFMLDSYSPLQDISLPTSFNLQHFLCAGNMGMLTNSDVYIWDSDPSDIQHRLHLLRDIHSAKHKFGLRGGFIESFTDWKAEKNTHINIKQTKSAIMPAGIYKYNHQPKHWVKQMATLWELSEEQALQKKNSHEQTNFFSIFIFFSAGIFFSIYRREIRLRDNFKRAIRYPYGFFIDMRERRIIPLFNSFFVGAFSAIIISTSLGAFTYFYHSSIKFQEILSHVLPGWLYNYILLLIQEPWTITAAFFTRTI